MRATKSKRRPRRLAASLAVAVLTLAGCGGSDESADDDGAAEAVDEATDGAASDAPADEQQDQPAEEPTDDEQEADESGPRAELPDSFPEDLVPLPSSVTITSTYQVDSGDAIAYSAAFTSTDSPEEVVDHIDGELDGDWNQIMRSSGDGSEFVAYAKEEDGDQVSITVSDSNGETEGSVTVILYK
jgi:hypothetical protein